MQQHRGGRPSRGKRMAVGIRIPVELFDAVERDRARVGATRGDCVWSILARHYDLPHLDPLNSPQQEHLDLERETAGAAKT